MSVLTRKRVLLSAVLTGLLLSTAAFAATPSPRNNARLVYDEQAGVSILFGGQSTAAAGSTGLTYDTNETWAWTGTRWIQRFPLHSPDGRSAHTMVYDSTRHRIVLFGGRREKVSLDDNTPYTYLNDTWVYQNGDWTQLETAEAPSPRYFAAATYDRDRDRIVLVGGNVADSAQELGVPVKDTWEFDGTHWTRVATGSPDVAKPNIAYDESRKQTIVLGTNATLETQMYLYDAAAHTWAKQTPAKLPPCVNEGAIVYNRARAKVQYMGGLCTTVDSAGEEVYEWDGETWTKLTTTAVVSRATGQAVTFDDRRGQTVMYGGQVIFSSLRSLTYLLDTNWHFGGIGSDLKPTARSLEVFRTDPINNTIWMFGGLDEFASTFTEDFWGYRGGLWFTPETNSDRPANCGTPYGAFDKDRARFVVSCVGTDTYEWDGSAWKFFTGLKKFPPVRRFAAMVYDETLKKTVLFGGFDTDQYRNDTWVWDGTSWTEIKPPKDRKPEARALFTMWYDPILKKTVLYSGLGRPNLDSRIVRFSDMWAFDGTGWNKLAPATTPGERFGSQAVVDPRTGKVLLFGGLLVEKEADVAKRQYFANDTWEWDGANWRKIDAKRSPAGRQNFGLAFDPASNQVVLYGGYAGFYYSDLWAWDPAVETWVPQEEQLITRRRSSGH
ncbi:MAG: large repetitive protein [Acidobacteriota bacterium]|nr:large repetitive protein [Acidobacteriota bacterium]